MALLAALGLPAPTAGRARVAPDVASPPVVALPGNSSWLASSRGSGAPTLVSIEIMPPVSEIDGEGVIPFEAVGRMSDKQTINLSPVVTWATSDPSAVSIDPDGTAHGHPVTGSSTITATWDEHPDIVGRRDLQVVALPRLGPELPKSYESWPAAFTVEVGYRPQLNVAGVFADGSRRNLNSSVVWKSSDDKVIRFDGAQPGVPVALAKGTATIVATDPITKRAAPPFAATVKDKAPPPAPPRWIESVELAGQEGPKGPWLVGQTFRVTASARYQDGKREDVTRRVGWRSNNEQTATIGADGTVRLVGIGRAWFYADFSALHAKSTPSSYFEGQVYGTPPKEGPKVPAGGRLGRAAALALVGGLVHLAQFRHDDPNPPGPFVAKPTGDKTADVLLKLVAGMVKKWGSVATILEARKIWAAVKPRLVDALKKAAEPPASLTPKEVNPGHDAIDALEGWVGHDPGGRQIELNYRHKRTPFGTISVTTNIADFAQGEDVFGWLQEHEELLVLRPKSVAALKALEGKQKQVQKAAGSLAALEKQVKARATKFAQQESKDFQAMVIATENVALSLEGFRRELEEAKRSLEVASAVKDATDADRKAAEARALAAEQGMQIDSMIAILKGGAIMATGGAIGLLEAVEVVKHVRSEWARTDVAKRADELTKRAQDLHDEASRKAVESAQQSIDSAKPLLAAAIKAVVTIEEHFELTRAEAEQAYDYNASTFRFADLQDAMALADQAAADAEAAAAKARRVRNGAAYFAKQVDWAKRPRFEGSNLQVVEAVGKDATSKLAATEADAKTIEASTKALREIRTTAHKALFTSKDPRKKPRTKVPTAR